ncbi:hypothetical protein E2C01_031631 [Portunus trituberculatus]|uniref:Uncharacterized protein n=1 Tax=Portunus trituberculatus TaxID=210409 RepID=A0A5B7EYM7_PORTR|nr:hypothetical protein [Portunus trituberculatus]
MNGNSVMRVCCGGRRDKASRSEVTGGEATGNKGKCSLIQEVWTEFESMSHHGAAANTQINTAPPFSYPASREREWNYLKVSFDIFQQLVVN